MHESIPLRIERALGPLGSPSGGLPSVRMRPVAGAQPGVPPCASIRHESHRRRLHMEPDEVSSAFLAPARHRPAEGTHVFIAGAFGNRMMLRTARSAPGEKRAVGRPPGYQAYRGRASSGLLGEDQPRYERGVLRRSPLAPMGSIPTRVAPRCVDKLVDMVLPSCRKVLEGRPRDVNEAGPSDEDPQARQQQRAGRSDTWREACPRHCRDKAAGGAGRRGRHASKVPLAILWMTPSVQKWLRTTSRTCST